MGHHRRVLVLTQGNVIWIFKCATQVLVLTQGNVIWIFKCATHRLLLELDTIRKLRNDTFDWVNFEALKQKCSSLSDLKFKKTQRHAIKNNTKKFNTGEGTCLCQYRRLNLTMSVDLLVNVLTLAAAWAFSILENENKFPNDVTSSNNPGPV